MKVNIENIAICSDCLFPILFDDYTGLDYHYSPEEADQKHLEIVAGILALSSFGHLVITEERDEFSTRSCDCCHSKSAGERHYFNTLIED